MILRKSRMELFFQYMKDLEDELSKEIELKEYLVVEDIAKSVVSEIDNAIKKITNRK